MGAVLTTRSQRQAPATLRGTVEASAPFRKAVVFPSGIGIISSPPDSLVVLTWPISLLPIPSTRKFVVRLTDAILDHEKLAIKNPTTALIGQINSVPVTHLTRIFPLVQALAKELGRDLRDIVVCSIITVAVVAKMVCGQRAKFKKARDEEVRSGMAVSVLLFLQLQPRKLGGHRSGGSMYPTVSVRSTVQPMFLWRALAGR
ncbi:hypothetical protein KC328_g112 [Hortaea werneckii]|nr:hypothetical protein KC328_g112 [Hortaea werneckii]